MSKGHEGGHQGTLQQNRRNIKLDSAEFANSEVSASEVAQSCPTLCDPMDSQAPPSMGFSRPDYWSGLPFPSPGDLPDPGIKPRSSAL